MAMRAYNAERLVRLHDQRWGALGDWRNRWEELSFYIMPQMRSFTSSYNPGNRRQEQLIYDSTALQANERLATRLDEAFTNPGTNWFDISFKDPALKASDAPNEWLDTVKSQMAEAIQESNFAMMMGQYYLDLPCLGTAHISCDEKKPQYQDESSAAFNGLTFKTHHMAGMSFAENADGHIDTQFDKFEMTAEQLVAKFGARAPKRAHDQMAEGKPDSKTQVLICRFPRYLETRPSGPLFPTERPWAEVWVNYSDKEMIFDGGTYEQAIFSGRWRKKSLDIMGYGPGERALPTIRTVNEAERLELAAWGKVIDPPMMTTMNNVVGDVNLRSKGVTVVRRMDEFAAIGIDPDLNHHMIQLEDKRFQIRDIFMYHQLELPPREQVGEMTAYEVSKRVEQVYRALGSTATQQQADVLQHLINRVFGMMYRKGEFPPLPAEVGEGTLSIRYIGPMGIAARATEIEAIDRYMGDAVSLAEVRPESMDLVDFDAAQRIKAEITGVPAIIVRDRDDVQKIRDDRDAALEEQRQTELAAQRASAFKDVGAAVGTENMAAAMAGGQ